jgi:ABC-type multidrug transport system fused ATPase/permease subunit
MKEFKKIFADVLFVSKIINTNNKKIIIFAAVVLAQLTAVSDIGLILFFAAIITGTFDQSNLFTPLVELILEYKFILPIIVVARFLFIYAQSVTLKKLELDIQENVKIFLLNEVFDKRNYSVADAYFYINVLSGHVSFFYSNLASFLNSILQIVAYLAYLFIADSRTVMTFMIGALIIIFPTKFLIKRAREYMHKSYVFGQQTNFEIQRIIDNMFLIKLLKKDNYELSKFSKTVKNLNNSDLKNHKYGAINSLLPSFVTMFIFSILLIFSSLAKAITLDFIGVTLRLFQSVGSFNAALNKIINSHVHLDKFYEIETNKLTINKENFITSSSKSSNAIEVKDVNFKYFNSEEVIFEKINLNIPLNSHTIVTGPNGSGKSTLLGLLSGVLYSQDGQIINYKNKFGYIGATPMIFTGSIRENLKYGCDNEIHDEEMLNLLKKFETFKEASNYNLDKKIDNKSLSSGQMQKLAFVRALLANVEILLLDESTANLDEKSRDLIFKILKDQSVTIINSTHDPQYFKNVDHNLRIKIVEEKRTLIFD